MQCIFPSHKYEVTNIFKCHFLYLIHTFQATLYLTETNQVKLVWQCFFYLLQLSLVLRPTGYVVTSSLIISSHFQCICFTIPANAAQVCQRRMGTLKVH